MTRNDIRDLFPDATDEQITKILNINGTDLAAAKASARKNSVSEDELNELRGFKTKYEALQKEDLTDADAIKQALAEAKKVQTDYAKRMNRLDAEKIFLGVGMADTDYANFIDGIVSDDAEKTKTLAENLANVFKSQKTALEEKIKEQLMDQTKGSGSAKGASGEKELSESEKVAKSIAQNTKTANETANATIKAYL